MNKYPTATTLVLCFHASFEDAEQVYFDNKRYTCPDCTAIIKEAKYRDGRVIISTEEREGLHLIGLSNN